MVSSIYQPASLNIVHEFLTKFPTYESSKLNLLIQYSQEPPLSVQ